MSEPASELPREPGLKPAWQRPAFWVVVPLWLTLVSGGGWLLWRGAMASAETPWEDDAGRPGLDDRPGSLSLPPEKVQSAFPAFSSAGAQRAAQRLAGVGVPRDYGAAVRELKVEAALGNPDAIVLLAEALLDGDPAAGVAPARAEALGWLRRPAAPQSELYRWAQERVQRDQTASFSEPGKMSADEVVLDLTVVDQAPRIKVPGRPYHPLALRFLRITGEVELKFIVDVQGRARDIVVVKSTHAGFEQAAIDDLRTATFEPGHKDGKAVNTRVAMPIRFRRADEPPKR